MVHFGIVNLQLETISARVRVALTHQSYQDKLKLHNVGLLLLEEPLHMRPTTSAICVTANAAQEEQLKLSNCWLPGWTAMQGGPSMMLKRAIDLLSKTSCHPMYIRVSDYIFCMKIPDSQEIGCKADIGSPLVCEDSLSNSFVQIGLLSDFDKNCQGPFVFMKLSRYIDWVEKATKVAGKGYTPPEAPWINSHPKPVMQHQNSVDHEDSDPGPSLVEVSDDPNSLDVRAPWQALVVSCTKKPCSGSIINDYWILTTAECMLDIEPDDAMVYVGIGGDELVPKDMRADRIFIHELYQSEKSNSHNIALILLRGPILFREDIGPLPLWLDLHSNASTVDNCGVTGMRSIHTGTNDPGEQDVTETNLNVQSANICPADHSLITRSTFCIQEPSPGVQLAKILEGSAILCQDPVSARWSQIGILSRVLSGVPVPAMCTTVTSYACWMNTTSKNAKRGLNLPPLTSKHPFEFASLFLQGTLLPLCLAFNLVFVTAKDMY